MLFQCLCGFELVCHFTQADDEPKRENILESWIMVEHLSEGDINLRDKTIKTWAGIRDEDYYQLFMDEIQKKKLKSYQQGGIVVYFGVFSFVEVIQFLRKEYDLLPPEEEIQVGNKFSFALYFDKELKLKEDMTFFTESYFIREQKKIPGEKEFSSFEEDNKRLIEDLFDCPEDVVYKVHFNKTIASILENYHIEVKKCRVKVLENLETDATNLHSFFVKDLERAKNIRTDNLDAYLLGKTQERKDLDCRRESEKYDPNVFNRILQPDNYPVSRFPGNPQYALSLMQQIAVNLAIGFDNEQIRSVNGPPGTGKTTLLKDIFAELVVEQALEISKMPDKMMRGSEETIYYENASIGRIPDKIAEKGIVVASSNNGAVQNIVNELPLLSGIGDEFADEINEADYFKKIANAKVFTKWVKDDNGKPHEVLEYEKNEEDDKRWGLFSLEGGKKDNMDHIITVLKHVASFLENEYIPDDEVYEKFIKQYEEVCDVRRERQRIADIYGKFMEASAQLEKKKKIYASEKTIREKKKDADINGISLDIAALKRQITEVKEKLKENKRQSEKMAHDIERIDQCIRALRSQKPGLFACRVNKEEYKKKQQDHSMQLIAAIEKERSCKRKEEELEDTIRENEGYISKKRQSIEAAEEELNKWDKKCLNEISDLEKQISEYESAFAGRKVNALNLCMDYDSFQKSNPWFDEEYRILQSRLFISALKVRKQFLYENRKNIKAAYIIWGKQKENLNKTVISEAWNWINMTVPVISSTFASFSRMCENLEKETLGHLFVDEAGQALPQASVGAIFRSRHVMVVGDPAQIKPVLTLDANILSMLGEYFGVSEKYLSESASTQTLVDAVSQYGFYKDAEKKDWIGIPLWVHRRCKYPMFSIANKISYGGNMVQGIEKDGKSEWYDICGSATDKYVREQGEFLKDRIAAMIKEQPDIIDKSQKDKIYVISPFKNVAYQLAQELKKIGFTRYENEKPTNIGTVHTFQGKEAPIVFLVLGADQKSRGAANWAAGTENPNIMNVAATRAKEEFYVIGDQTLYMSINSDVVDSTYNIIRDFNEKNERGDGAKPKK